MAEFEPAFSHVMKEEGFALTNDPDDHGKQTYCGISRKFHPRWVGWEYIDAGQTPATDLVRGFYRDNFWEPLAGGIFNSEAVAEAIFSQFVNMGANGIKLAQQCVGVIPDGIVGRKTLSAINAMNEELFLMRYALANIKRYHAIGMKDKTQRRFWPGWFARALRVLEAA